MMMVFYRRRLALYFIILCVGVFIFRPLQMVKPLLRGKECSDTSSPHLGVVVPGGGVNKDGTLPTHVKLRLDFAVDVYNQCAPGLCKV